MVYGTRLFSHLLRQLSRDECDRLSVSMECTAWRQGIQLSS